MQSILTKNQDQEWCVETYSTRQASLDYTAMNPGKRSLQMTLGGGRGDRIYIGKSEQVSSDCTSVVVRVMSRIFDKEPVKIGIVFTKSEERPWLELNPELVEQGTWKDLRFSLATLNREKLAKTDRLNLVIQTDGDEGFVLIDRIEFIK